MEKIEKPDVYCMIEETRIQSYYARNSIVEIIELLKECEIVSISLTDEFTKERDDDILHVQTTTKESPILGIKDIKFFLREGFYINPEYYKENPEICENYIIRVIENITQSWFVIDEDLILTPPIINAIVNNPYIIDIRLGERILNQNLYNELRKKENIRIDSKNVSIELENIFDGSISSNMDRILIDTNGWLTYENLLTIESILFQKTVSDKEIWYLKNYAEKLKKLTFENGSFISVRAILSEIKEKDIECILVLDNNENYDVKGFQMLANDFPYIKVSYRNRTVPIEEYINLENNLANLLEPIKGKELSELEKFLFAFNIAKQFRKYKENNNEKNEARDVFELFKENNEYIVCVGFAVLLEELCKRLEIPTAEASLSVSLNQTAKDGEILSAGHRRNMVNIKDNKYNIEGIYISDATWSNYIEHDIYVTALMTPQETLHMDRMIYESSTDLFMAQSYEEFIEIIYLQYRKDSHYRFDDVMEKLLKFYPELEKQLMLEEQYRKFKSNKFPEMEEYRLLFSDDSCMKKIFEFIYQKSNNVIPGNIIIEAAMNLKKIISPKLTEDELISIKNELVADNQKVYDDQFPQIVVEHGDEISIRANEQNKFGQGPRQI